eukprot:12410301-Karenia_brevis.AAC.1
MRPKSSARVEDDCHPFKQEKTSTPSPHFLCTEKMLSASVTGVTSRFRPGYQTPDDASPYMGVTGFMNDPSEYTLGVL